MVLALAAAVGAASSGGAQTVVFGYVIDSASERPVADAVVVLQDASGSELGRQRTDRAGRYEFADARGGRFRLEVSRVGFHPAGSPTLDLDAGESQRVDFHLDADPLHLSPLDVTAEEATARSPGLAGFEQRRARGGGWFMTGAEIERVAPARVTDILRRAPGIRVMRMNGGGPPVVVMARTHHCPALVYIDGKRVDRTDPVGDGSMADPASIDDLVAPESVAGIEVYQGMSRVPAEFLVTEAVCGVVAIWTRSRG